MRDSIIFDFKLLPRGELHYTVEKDDKSNTFNVDLYQTRPSIVMVKSYWVPMKYIHDILVMFSERGYIADRISF